MVFVIAALGTLLSVSQNALGKSLPNVALPSGIAVNIQPPGNDLLQALAAFIGKWGGYRGNTLASNLYVESVTELGQARVVYA